MRIGYARASTAADPGLEEQIEALTRAGCSSIFTDEAEGSRADRPGLDEAVACCGAGDILVVCTLDRLGRTVRPLMALALDLAARGVGLQSLADGIASDVGFVQVMTALARMEQALLLERTRRGAEAARARGRLGGRPRKLSPSEVVDARRRLQRESASTVARAFGVDRSTLYRALARSDTSEERRR